jgi:hypothetical protein
VVIERYVRTLIHAIRQAWEALPPPNDQQALGWGHGDLCVGAVPLLGTGIWVAPSRPTYLIPAGTSLAPACGSGRNLVIHAPRQYRSGSRVDVEVVSRDGAVCLAIPAPR